MPNNSGFLAQTHKCSYCLMNTIFLFLLTPSQSRRAVFHSGDRDRHDRRSRRCTIEKALTQDEFEAHYVVSTRHGATAAQHCVLSSSTIDVVHARGAPMLVGVSALDQKKAIGLDEEYVVVLAFADRPRNVLISFKTRGKRTISVFSRSSGPSRLGDIRN